MDIDLNKNGNDNNEKQNKQKELRKYIIIVSVIVLILLLVPASLAGYNYIRNKDNSTQSSSEDGALNNIQSGTDMIQAELSSDDSVNEEQSYDSYSAVDTSNITNSIGEYVSNTTDETIRLVNAYNLLPEDYSPELAALKEGKEFSVIAADQLQQMIDDCNARFGAGKLWAQSTFRSYSQQKSLYEKEVQKWLDDGMDEEDAAVKASTIVAFQGTSEHNTGLACDFNTITESFANTEMYEWLMEHCHEYGFVERYPKDKQEITGITWEPWHYRYVGTEAAQEMVENNWCLEEYHYYNGL